MTNYLRNTIILSIANALLVAVGVLLLPSLVLAVVWAIGALIVHAFALIWVGYAELRAEFGSRERHPTAKRAIKWELYR